jgi:hypothetical protein
MTLELVPLCTATVSLAEPIAVSPTLIIGEVLAMEVEGERLRASLKGRAAADWLHLAPAGVGAVDVRVTLQTDDGALIHAAYTGRFQLDTLTVYTTPLFHTGDERYAWLNRIQAVAKGSFPQAPEMTTLVYEMYELR